MNLRLVSRRRRDQESTCMHLIRDVLVCAPKRPKIWRKWRRNSRGQRIRRATRIPETESGRYRGTRQGRLWPRHAFLFWVGVQIRRFSAMLIRAFILRAELLKWTASGIYRKIPRLLVNVRKTQSQRPSGEAGAQIAPQYESRLLNGDHRTEVYELTERRVRDNQIPPGKLESEVATLQRRCD